MNSAHYSKSLSHRLPRLVGNSSATRLMEEAISRVGNFDCPVLVTGETGTGKDEVARAIHAAGLRAQQPFVAINCAGIVGTLAESQLFGHEKGSFTGAAEASLGAFRAAHRGILFLDEIGELSLDLQPKILRALELREVNPVGATRPVMTDVQVIAATNRDLPHEVARGGFREDLFYRLNTIQITVPPLRARRDDIPLFVAHFAAEYAAGLGRPGWMPPAEVIQRFVDYSWPGNIRELRQTILRLFIFEDRLDEILSELEATIPAVEVAKTTPQLAIAAAPATFNLREIRLLTVRRALAAAEGHYGRAAAMLGVSAKTMTKLVTEACPGAVAARGRRKKSAPAR